MDRSELIAVIYRARWVDGIRNLSMATDSAIADAIIKQATETEVKAL